MPETGSRLERYLDVLGVAADVFLDERDVDASLARISRMIGSEDAGWLTLYRPDAGGGFADRYLELVVQTREPLVISEPSGDGGAASTMLVPILGSEETWGILQFRGNHERPRFDGADLAFGRDLAKLAAITLDNAALLHRAEEALDELRFLGSVGETMVESLDLQTRLDRLLRAVVPRLADWATVNLLEDDGSIETLAIVHRDPAMADIVARLRGPYYGNIETNAGTPIALRTGAARLLRGVDNEFLRDHIRPETYDDVRALGADSAFVVPLVAHGTIYGTLSAMRTERERPFTDHTMRLIEELARPAAVAIANAKLFERSSTVADAFQQASLPVRLPRVPGVAFSAHYAAGRGESTVGGDWYDAFGLPDGRIVVSIGDVAGSGLRAAVQMGCVRQLIRGAAQLEADPGVLLDAVDSALRSEYPDAIVTAVVATFDPETHALVYASAGHPPPFVRSPDGTIEQLPATGLPLGLRSQKGAQTDTRRCEPGTVLLLYTDGLTESTRDVLAGEQRVRAALAEVDTGRPSDVARLLHDRVLADGAHDDVALLALVFL